MLKPDPPARLAKVSAEEFTDETRLFFSRWDNENFKNSSVNPPLWTFAHHPRLADVFSQFNIHLLTTSTLPLKQRQIAILRTAWLCRSKYMWSSHLRTSMNRGLTPDMFQPIKVGSSDPYFTDFERVVINATEELLKDKKVSDKSWRELSTEWDNQQLLDFMFTVGCYVTVAGVLRSTGVEREPELLELAALYGEPEDEEV